MYSGFYGLKANPFDITPDPHFFFPTPQHNEAMANLFYAVRWRKGFAVVTGEVGTGKTLLLRCLLDLLTRAHVASAYVFNPRLSPHEFLQQIVYDLGLHSAGRNKNELLAELQQYLINRHRRGSTTVLIIDEAHLLSWDLLEEVRLLGNLETPKEKLLQILLVGQPELARTLDSPELRQLKQRIGLRCILAPLQRHEVKSYIEKRLILAGREPDCPLFVEPTFDSVYSYSRGIPRIVNTICENALICGCARQAQRITTDIIEEVAADFRLVPLEQSGLSFVSSGLLPARPAREDGNGNSVEHLAGSRLEAEA